ncbi:hypothetical protein GCM10010401_16130 [Rarobacter faecitabidus]|uniref:Trypsin n=1 Tax=Rarobacter faecitabidus TaxID=13243 RepID=A0A542ZXB7_RARFA|nr:S1 family peptidase [Rarobacter faecitabidus]TQL64985.1 hypothetical protein FB461_1518 [Rarobacter faecitabidus]
MASSRIIAIQRSIACSLMLSLAFASTAAIADEEVPQRALTRVGELDSADIYAEYFDVTPSQIRKSQEMSDYAASLEMKLSEDFPKVLSGVSINLNTSIVSVYAKLNEKEGQELVKALLADKQPYQVEVHESASSMYERAKVLASLSEELEAANVIADLSGDMKSGKILAEVAQDDIDGRKTIESLTREAEKTRIVSHSDEPRSLVEVQVVEALAQPAAAGRGGNHTAKCTIGLPLVNTSGNRFLTTAGHCTGTQNITAPNAISTTLKQSFYSGSRDMRILTIDGNNTVGTGLRYKNSAGTWLSQSITGIKTRNATVIGSIVCKAGRTIATACGEVTSKEVNPGYVANGNATFIRSKAQTSGGDSGGPVFLQSTAYGFTSGAVIPVGASKGDLIFQSVTYIPSGYAVLTTSS